MSDGLVRNLLPVTIWRPVTQVGFTNRDGCRLLIIYPPWVSPTAKKLLINEMVALAEN